MPQDNGAPGLGAGWIIPRWLSWALVGVPVGGAALVFIAIAVMGVPRLYHSVTPNDQGVLPAVTTELSAALREHQAIVRVVGMCAATPNNADVNAVIAQPIALLDVHGLWADPVKAEENPPSPALPGYLDAMLYLSQSIANARSQLAGKAVIDELISELFEWTLVATGLFTTILISVKAFASPRSRGYLSMAVMAIVLSSLGTAVATLNSFYTPRIAYEKTERSLASLRTLHWTLAGELLRARNPCKDKGSSTDWRPQHVRDLTNTFVTIMAASMNPASTATDGPNPANERDDNDSDSGTRSKQTASSLLKPNQ